MSSQTTADRACGTETANRTAPGGRVLPSRRREQRGHQFAVDVAELLAVIGRRRRPIKQIEEDAELSSGYLHHIIKRGGCSLATADRLAMVLDVDLWQIEAA